MFSTTGIFQRNVIGEDIAVELVGSRERRNYCLIRAPMTTPSLTWLYSQ